MYTFSKTNSGRLSFVHNKSKEFQIGFESATQARHVQYNINPVRYNFRLQLSPHGVNRHNIEDYVKIGKKVYMDTSAILSLDKKNEKQRTFQKALVQELTYMINTDFVDVQSFITQPFISNQNVVLPKKIIHEDLHKIMFQCIAIYSEPETLEEIKVHLSNFCL